MNTVSRGGISLARLLDLEQPLVKPDGARRQPGLHVQTLALGPTRFRLVDARGQRLNGHAGDQDPRRDTWIEFEKARIWPFERQGCDCLVFRLAFS